MVALLYFDLSLNPERLLVVRMAGIVQQEFSFMVYVSRNTQQCIARGNWGWIKVQ